MERVLSMGMDNYGSSLNVSFVGFNFRTRVDRYNFTNGISNLAGRPISLMITNTSKSLFSGIRFVQSQF